MSGKNGRQQNHYNGFASFIHFFSTVFGES